MRNLNLPHFTWKKAILAVVAFCFLVGGGVLVWASTVRLPDVSTFEARKIANSSKITDRTGEVVLYDIHQSVRRTEIPLSEMGMNIRNAVVAIEDAHFYEHSGIRPTSIVRAVFVNVVKGEFSQGGSTITQQIIKNTLLTNNKTVVRKFKEWILALKIERYFTKDQILQIYLNDAPFGGTIYGVEEAAQAYFNKKAKDLTLGQASYLAAMMPAPTYYSPNGSHRAKLDERHILVLKKMLEYGYINEAQFIEASNEKVAFNNVTSNSIRAPHFVFYILDYLQKKYGEDVMESGGYTITTTIDYDLQAEAERIVKENSLKNQKQFAASNAGLVAIDPTTGQILTMVGSRDYFDKTIDGAYNIATANRQPGSSFKPFIYATAFAKGYLPETVLFDVPTEFSTACATDPENCYHPGNFDDKFKGPINLRSALAESRNIPSVKLLYLVGVKSAIDTAHALGITTLKNESDYGLSLVLGGGEVKLLDMVSAYGVFANSGVKNQTTGILEVRDRKGNVIEQYEQRSEQVMDKNVVLTLNDVLSDAQARTPTFGNSITIAGTAVKTGTTNDNRDAWIVGYTPTIAVGVWSGNNNNSSMKSGGAAISGPTWKQFMEQVVLKKFPLVPFEKPLPDPDMASLKPILRGQWMGNDSVWIDSVTGLRATENTPPEARVERVITNVHSILHWVDKEDPRGEVPKNPSKDSQYRLWESSVQRWWNNNKYNYNTTGSGDIPDDFENIHNQQNTSPLTINGLPSSLDVDDTATMEISSSGQYPLTSVDIFINDSYLTTLSSAPFRFTFKPQDYGYQMGQYTLKFIGTNSIFSKSEAIRTLQVTQ
jgi:1A family penicillin-binding protein